MPSKTRRLAPTIVDVEQSIKALKSERKVRPVVTPGGHRARGHFPSLKGLHTRFESLVEEDALRVMEIASCVLKMETHPWVLKLTDGTYPWSKPIHYTPDLYPTMRHTAALVEVKGDWLLTLPKPRANLVRVLSALRRHNVPIALISESDVRPAGLQTELKELLRDRPVVGRRRVGMDTAAWDPLGQTSPSADVLRRWRAAQKECDDLLDRVMRRDPDEVVETLRK